MVMKLEILQNSEMMMSLLTNAILFETRKETVILKSLGLIDPVTRFSSHFLSCEYIMKML